MGIMFLHNIFKSVHVDGCNYFLYSLNDSKVK
jgi:hypothetical protein